MADVSRKTIVVAGGTGGIGQHIVGGIVAAKKFTVKVLTRQDPSSASDLTAKGVEVIKVDYSNHEQLVRALRGVHTVIVSLISMDASCIESQVNLLNAALEAKVKRFAPSEWTGHHDEHTVIKLMRDIKIPVLDKVKASGIEYTVFMNGVLMDYFAAPQKSSSSLDIRAVGVDFNKCEANIVGTGDEPFSVILADDVGRFVAAALDLDRWDERSGMVGNRTTWNELIKLGEEVRGKKFDVKRATVEETWKQYDPNGSNQMANFMTEVFVAFAQGEFDFEPTLDKKFPHIKPTTIRHFIVKWWGDKQGRVL